MSVQGEATVRAMACGPLLTPTALVVKCQVCFCLRTLEHAASAWWVLPQMSTCLAAPPLLGGVQMPPAEGGLLCPLNLHVSKNHMSLLHAPAKHSLPSLLTLLFSTSH